MVGINVIRRETCRLGLLRDGILAVFLAVRSTAAHRTARRRYVGADSDGALCCNDCITARGLDGGAAKDSAFKWSERAGSLVTRRACCRAQWVIPNNSSGLNQPGPRSHVDHVVRPMKIRNVKTQDFT